MNQKCLSDCANCIKDGGDDICKIAANDDIRRKIEPDDEVPDVCYKKGYFKDKKHKTPSFDLF